MAASERKEEKGLIFDTPDCAGPTAVGENKRPTARHAYRLISPLQDTVVLPSLGVSRRSRAKGHPHTPVSEGTKGRDREMTERDCVGAVTGAALPAVLIAAK